VSIAADPVTGLITVQGVRAALEAGATTIYLENPGRLTGKLIDPAELADIAALIVAADARAICDEGLADWLPDEVEHTALASLPGMAVRTLCFGLPWGGMGLEAWGLGYVAGPSELIAQCRSVKQMISICTNTVSQWSAAGASQIRALEHAERMAMQRDRYSEATSVAERAGVQLVSGEALASLAVIAAPGSAEKLAQSGFAVMDGADFGAPDRVRIVISPDGAAARALRYL
jgi:aspartate/methionine/tyrosine aminotransferase